jgi:hypothetical protein
VWGKSDIDLLIVTQETKHCSASVGLVQEGINVHAFLLTRSGFKKTMEGAVQSSFMHSLLMKGGILFSRDETIEEMFANRERKRPLHSR